MKKISKSTKRDQYTVVLESLRSDFGVFGESLDDVRRNLDVVKEELGGVKEQLGGVKEELGGVKEHVENHTGRLVRIEADLQILKGEVALIRHNQVTRDEFNLLQSRVLRLEKTLVR